MASLFSNRTFKNAKCSVLEENEYNKYNRLSNCNVYLQIQNPYSAYRPTITTTTTITTVTNINTNITTTTTTTFYTKNSATFIFTIAFASGDQF